jgi:hypothetical protein
LPMPFGRRPLFDLPVRAFEVLHDCPRHRALLLLGEDRIARPPLLGSRHKANRENQKEALEKDEALSLRLVSTNEAASIGRPPKSPSREPEEPQASRDIGLELLRFNRALSREGLTKA